ncbi:MAG: hypothetical protein M1818_007852 [Claussenomyces sp. TS43310]|nr:MAG: hypothetical protein M1818_007852 [Claussenomyces sp. TS43310]
MAESTLQDRLREHAKSFDGLLSLIPAKLYYGQDTSDQWKKKKQTKEEAAAARRAKLDPDSAKSAKDVMDERARKRKLDEAEDFDVEGVQREQPKQGLKTTENKNKKQKMDSKSGPSALATSQAATLASQDEIESRKKAKAEQKNLKQQQKKEKLAKKAEKKKANEEQLAEQSVDLEGDTSEIQIRGKVGADDESRAQSPGKEIEMMEVDGLADEDEVYDSTAPPSPTLSPTFDNNAEPSANTSTSSVIPPAIAPQHIKIPTDPELLKARLAARIEALRSARKADGHSGAPAKNRQQLMEARRKKEEQRRAHKKELRLKAKVDEEARREEALESARDSPASGVMSPALHTASENNFSFGRVAFADGQQLTDDLSRLLSAPKKKGPQDPATALQGSEKKRLRLAAFDQEKRADIEEKELWLKARKRAHGEKVHDDTSLLKKTLKRKEKAKKKSEKEWTERKEGVAKSQAMKQKKREENLRKRKEEKGGGKGKGKGKGKGAGAKKGAKKNRPGFEGHLGGGKKK